MARIEEKRRVLLIHAKNQPTADIFMQLRKSKYIITAQQFATIVDDSQTESELFDGILLAADLMSVDQINLCRLLRGKGVMAPVIALSNTSDTESVNAVLEAGADDYVVNPFHLNELAARLEAVIRRDKRTFGSNQLQVNDFVLNLDNNCVTLADKSAFLTTSEAKVLRCLLQYAPEVVGRKCFFEQVWGIDDSHASNRLDVYIRRIRRKLKAHDIIFTIQTVHGQGYKIPK